MAGYDTEYPADSVEFCPSPREDARSVFVCGTYKLEQDRKSTDNLPTAGKQRRLGRCIVFKVTSSSEAKYREIQRFDLPAILDMKWQHNSLGAEERLAIADSEGSITLHRWDTEECCLKLQHSVRCAPSDVLCLSLDWSDRRGHGKDIIVSLSNGELALLRPDTANELVMSESWAAHEHEPWIAAWDCWNTTVVYSGGDDLTMKAWDTREGTHQPIWTNKRFEGGVTSIQSHPHIEHMLAVGSYDDTVRLFDVRKPTRPLAEANVGGGAWRVKWHPHPHRKNDLLVACMHDGFKVVRFHGTDELASSEDHIISKRFDEHQSLAYGVDWSYSEDGLADTLIASGSFYDARMHLWRG